MSFQISGINPNIQSKGLQYVGALAKSNSFAGGQSSGLNQNPSIVGKLDTMDNNRTVDFADRSNSFSGNGKVGSKLYLMA